MVEKELLENPGESHNFELTEIEKDDTIPDERPIKFSIIVPVFKCKSGLKRFHIFDVMNKRMPKTKSKT